MCRPNSYLVEFLLCSLSFWHAYIIKWSCFDNKYLRFGPIYTDLVRFGNKSDPRQTADVADRQQPRPGHNRWLGMTGQDRLDTYRSWHVLLFYKG